MDGIIHPPTSEERDTSKRSIVIAIVVVAGIAGIVAWLLRGGPSAPSGPPPYAANLKFSDLKMSQAQNFVGATVTYVDGTLTDNAVAALVVGLPWAAEAFGQ
jgi:hypothetical protein